MQCKLALIGLSMACALLAQNPKTEKVDFPAGGTLRIEHSAGELTIEGWDQPGIEITTTKEKKDQESRDLDRVQISTKTQGNEVVITTEYPSHLAFPYVTGLARVKNFNLDYHIKLPRSAKLVIHHTDGEVHITDVAGSIDASAHQGLITVFVTGDTPPSIDAKSRIGSVNSDFPGQEKAHELFIGHSFIVGGTATQNLKLRIAYGDIIIGKSFQKPPVSARP